MNQNNTIKEIRPPLISELLIKRKAREKLKFLTPCIIASKPDMVLQTLHRLTASLRLVLGVRVYLYAFLQLSRGNNGDILFASLNIFSK